MCGVSAVCAVSACAVRGSMLRPAYRQLLLLLLAAEESACARHAPAAAARLQLGCCGMFTPTIHPYSQKERLERRPYLGTAATQAPTSVTRPKAMMNQAKRKRRLQGRMGLQPGGRGGCVCGVPVRMLSGKGGDRRCVRLGAGAARSVRCWLPACSSRQQQRRRARVAAPYPLPRSHP